MRTVYADYEILIDKMQRSSYEIHLQKTSFIFIVNIMNGFIKRLLCKHDYRLIRVIYGDEVVFDTPNYNRRVYKCNKCEKFYYE